MRVALIAKTGYLSTGLGRYVFNLSRKLRQFNIHISRVTPIIPPFLEAVYSLIRRMGFDAHTFFTNYPICARYPEADIYHFTSQNLASLLVFKPPKGRVVVTVHDIFPFMMRKNPQLSYYRTFVHQLFDGFAMSGLRRADRLIAVSSYTKRCLTEHLNILPEKVEVVHEGIAHDQFRPLTVPTMIRERYGLSDERQFLIHVGTEEPRKNLASLLCALAGVRKDLPNVELIKVGRNKFHRERKSIINLADQLGIKQAIHFLDNVPEEDLAMIYNLAEVCVMPSLYEGFGFPVLEAMACGTPVICSNTSSLPEVVGDAAMLFDPLDELQLIGVMKEVLVDRILQEELILKGMERASLFHWDKATQETIQVYRKILSS